MANKPPTQNCANCRYAYASSTGDQRCRRFRPVPTDDPNVYVNWRQPIVNDNEWCGEWAPAEPETVTEGAAILARLVLLGDLTAARALADKLKEG